MGQENEEAFIVFKRLAWEFSLEKLPLHRLYMQHGWAHIYLSGVMQHGWGLIYLSGIN